MPKRYWYIIFIYLAAQLSGAIVIPFIGFIDVDPTALVVGWLVISLTIGLFFILYLLRDEMKQGMERGPGIGSIILWCIIGFFLAYFAQFASIMFETHVLNIKPGSENTMELMKVARAAPIFILVITVIAPILEEIIFRKIIFGSIYKRTNFILAALSSAFIFALIHNDLPHILTYTAVGIVFAFLYVQTKRIIVPIIAHMMINSLAVLGQYHLDPEELEKMLEEFEKIQMIIIGG
ncbi:CPBP family intramembrane glutamic endopeptidase [Aquibacillus albus]|uniref:Membrane protease YdiL (CAAX protease family) n=1 Tax=Aquibacillus albus TaxID=1168171 RepID=A0ABS2N681_9BACI|nr:type II CAAX endopeptidase family protein [Aquibacillus albus]MBM7573613.1 membrane protease YdiL (CAAX protease family) [Aquibacillus albus]